MQLLSISLKTLVLSAVPEYVDKTLVVFQNLNTTRLTEYAPTAWPFGQERSAQGTLKALPLSVAAKYKDKALVLCQNVDSTYLTEYATTAWAWALGQEQPIPTALKAWTLSGASVYQARARALYHNFGSTSLTGCATTALTWAQDHRVLVGWISLNTGLSWAYGPMWLPALALKLTGFGKVGVGAGRLRRRLVWYEVQY